MERVRSRPGRQSPREPLREPVHQKAARASREPAHEPPTRKRRKKLLSNDDQFYLPVDEIPEGSSYEWKRLTVMGQEDPFYMAQLREQGWEPVLASRHPNWLPPGYDKPNIIKGGQILMERPMELTVEARSEERQLAKRQMREAEARLGMTPRGEMTRNFPGVEARVTKEIMRPLPVQGED